MVAIRRSAGSVAAQYGALAVTWGASFLFIKIGLEGLSPGQVVLGRLVSGAVTLAVISAARRSRMPRDPVAWAHLAVVAVLLCDAPFLLFAWAERNVPSSVASIYNAATPLMTAVAGLAALPGERPTRTRLAGLVTGFAGVVLVLAPWHLADRSQPLAQLACLAATACYGAGFTYLRRFVSPRGLAALSAATIQVSLATVIALALVPWTATAPVRLSPAVTGSVLALGALGTGIAYVWNTGVVAAWGATIASTVTYLIPIAGVALGVAVLAETLTWNEPVGAVIVILGVLTSQNRLVPVIRRISRRLRRDGRPAALRRDQPIHLPTPTPAAAPYQRGADDHPGSGSGDDSESA
jgi:drug/metabolite transporter (DMT)-like permease